MELYRQRIDGRSQTGEAAEMLRKVDQIERTLRLSGLHAERDAIYKSTRARKIDDETSRKIVREIDLTETRLG